jgi:hypothetical protein
MNTNSKTPRTDAAIVSAEYIRREMDYYAYKFVLSSVAAELETELVAANARIAELENLVSEMTHNQRMQDSITAQVMERAEKAEAECAGLRVGAERYQWLRKQAHPTSPESFWVARGGYGPSGISIWWLESLDAAIDAAMGK